MIVFYMIARNQNDLKKTAFIQPAATLVALIITSLSFFSPYSNHEYTIWILAGISSKVHRTFPEIVAQLPDEVISHPL